jgi:hypothetical protein
MERIQRRGFTLADGAGLIAAIGLIGVVAIAQQAKDDFAARQTKDATQIRGIHQGMVLWAQNNEDRYPIPSKHDSQDQTIKATDPMTKETTANIYSVLIFNGYLPTSILVSPAETSLNIAVDQDYELTNPKAAATPATALWDPAFSADFTRGNVGNTSYAHQIPASERRERWSNTFQADEPILGNRGPKVESVDEVRDAEGNVTVVPELANELSQTFDLFGDSKSWKGNIAFNDNHVEFLAELMHKDVMYDIDKPLGEPGQRRVADVIFFDESDAKNRQNAYLGIFTKAGERTKAYRAIWD